jgi:hypothetical protein
VPPALRRQLDDNEQGVLVQKRFIADQEIEVKRIGQRFDEELERLKPLWAGQGGGRAAASTTTRKAP